MKREPMVESALIWARNMGYTCAGVALDDYCNARGLVWGESYDRGIVIKESNA